MKISHPIAVLVLAAGVAGCANPKVIYSKVSASDPGGAVKFKFAHSMLVTTAQVDKNNAVTGYTIQSVPVTASADPKYQIAGAPWYQNWGVDTTLNATYLSDSSDLLKEVGVAVQDNRVTAITDLGSIAAAVAAMAAQGHASAPQQVAQQIDVTPFLTTPPPAGKCQADGDDLVCTTNVDAYGWSATIRIGPLPVDRLDLSLLSSAYASRAYLFSACRTAQVALKWSHDGTAAGLSDSFTVGTKTIILPTATVQIADPNYLEALALPPAGKVDARGSCGAESTSSDSKASSDLDLLSAAAKAAQTAKDAVDGKTPAKN